jgi:HSP20 family protein
MSFWDDWMKRFRERRGFFFPEIDRLVDEMEKEMSRTFRDMENTMPRDMVRVRRLPDGSVKREYGPFVYGYSVKIGPDGKPIVREFGNIKPGPSLEGEPPLNLQDRREPLIDLIEENGKLKVVTELPGVEKEDINLYVTRDTLTLDVDTSERRYHKKLELPFEIDENSATSTYRNGVLETVLKKKEKIDRGTQIKIE